MRPARRAARSAAQLRIMTLRTFLRAFATPREIAEESEVPGVFQTGGRQTSQSRSRLDLMRASPARTAGGEVGGGLVATAEVHLIWCCLEPASTQTLHLEDLRKPPIVPLW
jgi:hypothetical protein